MKTNNHTKIIRGTSDVAGQTSATILTSAVIKGVLFDIIVMRYM